MPPHIFGWQHIVFLVVFAAVSAAGLTLVKLKVKDEKTLNIIIKCLGGVLLALLVWNRIAICLHKNSWLYLIPDSFCGVSSLLLGICCLVCKHDALPFHYLVYIAVFGGIANDLYPYYLGQAPYFTYPATISGMLHHSLALDIGILLTITGYFKPSVKKYYAFPVGICINMCYGIFLLDAFGVNSLGEKGFETAMYIGSPLVGPLTWYIVFPATAVALLGLLFLYEYLIKRRAQNKAETAEE